MRADARRNRARILEVAFATFAAEGLSVPVHEIARRAGVGTGTVSRHFPTKEALFQALIEHRAAQLLDEADALARGHADDPAAAFFAFLGLLTADLGVDRGLADALAGAGIDLEQTDAGQQVTARLGQLLDQAQRAGAVRPDVRLTDVKALMTGCLIPDADAPRAAPATPADPARPEPSPEVRRRLAVVCAGLRAPAP
jgi:AcrR family transcriptional regulator